MTSSLPGVPWPCGYRGQVWLGWDNGKDAAGDAQSICIFLWASTLHLRVLGSIHRWAPLCYLLSAHRPHTPGVACPEATSCANFPGHPFIPADTLPSRPTHIHPHVMTIIRDKSAFEEIIEKQMWQDIDHVWWVWAKGVQRFPGSVL